MDRAYVGLLNDIREFGVDTYNKRTRKVCRVLPNQILQVPTYSGQIPILQLRKINWQAALAETKWFINGHTNTNQLGYKFWDPWADDEGNLGPIYGRQWERQLQTVIDNLLERNDNRRLIVNSWQLDDLPDMRLPPCHYTFQFTLTRNKLHLLVNMRSCDVPIGLPFNILNYWFLLKYMCWFTKLNMGQLTFMIANAHYYQNQVEAVDKLLFHGMNTYPLLTYTAEAYRDEREIPANSLDQFRRFVNNVAISPLNYNPVDDFKIPVTV